MRSSRPRFGRILAVIAVVGVAPSSAAIAGTGDAFLCYDAGPASAPRGQQPYPAFAPVKAVTVLDGFSSTLEDDRHAVDLRSVQGLCSPAVVGGRGIGAAAAHLEDYRLRQSRTRRPQPPFASRVHTVIGIFGEVTVVASKQNALLIPSALALGASGVAGTTGEGAVDHFQCYKARALGSTNVQRLVLTDAFGARTYDLGRPTRVCLPADVNGRDPTAPTHHHQLLCHAARLARTKPRQPRPEEPVVSTENELGDEVLQLGKPREVCLDVSNAPDPPTTATPALTPTPTSTPTQTASPVPTATGHTLVRISLRPPEIARLPTEVKHFWATGHYADGSTEDLTNVVVWSSSDTNVATALNDPADRNRMDLHALGTALISATDPATGLTTRATGDDAVLHVTGPLHHINVHPYWGYPSDAGYEQFTAVGYYWNADNSKFIPRNITQDVEWSVSDPAIATAENPAGDRSRIVGHAVGITGVWATDPATGIESFHCARSGPAGNYCGGPLLMVLGELESIYLVPAGYPYAFANLRVGHTARVAAVGQYQGGYRHITQECTFSAADPAIFGTPNRPGDRGVIEALGGGTTTITATHDSTGIVSAPFTHNVWGQLIGISIPHWLLRPRASAMLPFYPFRDLTAVYANGTAVLREWEVTVDDPSVAYANGSSVVPLRPGVVSVGARDPESGVVSADRLQLTFYGDVERLVLSPEAVALRVGDEDQLTALLEREGGFRQVVTQWSTYTSSKPNVVEAHNAPGYPPHRSRIVAVAPGEGVISATYDQWSTSPGSDTLVTVVGALRKLRVTPEEAITSVGRSVQLAATGVDGAEREINLTQTSTWAVSDARIAAAPNATDDRSRIDGLAPGKVTVRATDPVTGRVGEGDLTVIGPIGSLLLLPETLSLLPGANDYVTAVGVAADGTLNLTQDVLYTSDDPNVVVIANDAFTKSRIIAVAPGTARITATDPLTGLASSEVVVTVVDRTP